MFKTLLIGAALAVTATPPLPAQGPLSRNCLHSSPESAGERARREQAIAYAVKVNAAETSYSIGPPS